MRRHRHWQTPRAGAGTDVLLDVRLLETTRLRGFVDLARATRSARDGMLAAGRFRLADARIRGTDNRIRSHSVRALMRSSEGLSNAAIAARLFVNARTVEAHTKQIFQKLGIHADSYFNRCVLAVLAYLRSPTSPARSQPTGRGRLSALIDPTHVEVNGEVEVGEASLSDVVEGPLRAAGCPNLRHSRDSSLTGASDPTWVRRGQRHRGQLDGDGKRHARGGRMSETCLARRRIVGHGWIPPQSLAASTPRPNGFLVCASWVRAWRWA